MKSDSCDAIPSWKEVVASPEGYSFDEWPGVSSMWQRDQKDKMYDGMVFGDIHSLHKRFLSVQKQILNMDDGKSHFIFEYDKRKLWRVFWNETEKRIEREATLYVHFQKRDMMVKTPSVDRFLIVPNCFIPWQDVTDNDVMRWGKKYYFYKKYFCIR